MAWQMSPLCIVMWVIISGLNYRDGCGDNEKGNKESSLKGKKVEKLKKITSFRLTQTSKNKLSQASKNSIFVHPCQLPVPPPLSIPFSFLPSSLHPLIIPPL